MYNKPPNANIYKFQWLITGISGPGIPEVYLPEIPSDDKILFKKEQKWVRPEMPPHLQKAVKEMLTRRVKNPDYVHPLEGSELAEWEHQEWERGTNGVYIFNKGVPTYLTPFYYKYLSAWRPYFGSPSFRDTDKEITYWIQYWEEDPNSAGGCFNTVRRYGKSVLMGSWATFRTISNYNHFSGMQGETDDKIKKFYNKFVKKPFYKLPYYYQPSYNTDTKQTSQIEFDVPPRRRESRSSASEVESLESIIEYRESSEGAYDGDILNTYLCEEPGKLKKTSLYSEDGEGRWDIVLPCLMDGLEFIGKCLMGTTVENLNMKDRGGKAYKNLFYDSDFDKKQPDGRTKSNLYSAFLPGDCALKGFFDEWGFPKREEARAKLLQRRAAFKNSPSKLAGHIRKYPLTIREIFYTNPASCEFNAVILENRKTGLYEMTEPIVSRGEFYWLNNKRFGEVRFRHNPHTGWAVIHSLPSDPKETNLVNTRLAPGQSKHSPGNDQKFIAGVDPIDHGVQVEGKSGTDEFISTRRSRPVLFIKRKYDTSIDGFLTQEIMEQRRDEQYPYKTNRYVAMMDVRPNDPNVFYERALMMCWFFGCSLHPESQKPGVINYFHEQGCGDFILSKYVPETGGYRKNVHMDGTPASQITIQEYTGALATYVEYFGHTIPFIELVEDLLVFNPKKTTEYDYSVAAGFTELGCKIAPKMNTIPLMDIHDFMPGFDQYGNVVR
jgi:hypothetical protein